MLTLDGNGWVVPATHVKSPNFDQRPTGTIVDLLVIHNISLPPNEFGGDGVKRLFTNSLDPRSHPFYQSIQHLRVSAHFFIRRDGELVQFVSCFDRAWHAGQSSWFGRDRCNDFSIGIELEGTDNLPFTDEQYYVLRGLANLLKAYFPFRAMQGHSDIAPGRKTDPGPYFDWPRLSDTGISHTVME
nr:1,6-anhydro-N-acetylmuramyl-L-alanine amidase AmpD [Chitinivorax sp. B]